MCVCSPTGRQPVRPPARRAPGSHEPDLREHRVGTCTQRDEPRRKYEGDRPWGWGVPWARSVDREGAWGGPPTSTDTAERKCSRRSRARFKKKKNETGSEASDLGEQRSRRHRSRGHGATRRTPLCHSRGTSSLDFVCLRCLMFTPPQRRPRQLQIGPMGRLPRASTPEEGSRRRTRAKSTDRAEM